MSGPQSFMGTWKFVTALSLFWWPNQLILWKKWVGECSYSYSVIFGNRIIFVFGHQNTIRLPLHQVIAWLFQVVAKQENYERIKIIFPSQRILCLIFYILISRVKFQRFCTWQMSAIRTFVTMWGTHRVSKKHVRIFHEREKSHLHQTSIKESLLLGEIYSQWLKYITIDYIRMC